MEINFECQLLFGQDLHVHARVPDLDDLGSKGPVVCTVFDHPLTVSAAVGSEVEFEGRTETELLVLEEISVLFWSVIRVLEGIHCNLLVFANVACRKELGSQFAEVNMLCL